MLVNGKWRIDLEAEHQRYFNAARKQVPGVTTVNGVFEKVALRGWYAETEREGIKAHLRNGGTLDTLPEKDGKPQWFADIKKDRAADVGSVCHARCEAFLKGPYPLDEEGLSPELLAASMPGFLRFQELWVRNGYTLLNSELQMVSERMQVGGTLDIVARDRQGFLVLMDLKTSKASKWWPYPDVFSQVAAYAAIYEEITTNRIDRIMIERIGKAENDPGQSYEVSDAKRAAGLRRFELAREAYELNKELKP